MICTLLVCYLLHTAGDGSHATDVDLGTLGRRPFAMREDDTTGSETTGLSATLESISETSESDTVSPLGTIAQERFTLDPKLHGSPQTDGQMDFDLSAGSTSKTIDKISNCSSSGGVGARTKNGDQSHLGGGSTGLSTGQEVCNGEIKSSETCESDTSTVRTEARNGTRTKSQRLSRKERRRSSFLIPFLGRRDSFTPSFVKPSQSALRQIAARKAARRRLGAIVGTVPEADVASEESQQEEIEMPEDVSGGDSDRDRLLEEELSRTRRVLKRVGQSIKHSLFDLRLFLW